MKYHVLHIPAWYPTPWDRINGISFRNQALALNRYGHRIGIVAPQHYTLKKFGKAQFKRGFSKYVDEGIPTYRYYGWAWLPKVPYGNSTLWVNAGMTLFERYVEEHGKPDLIHASCVLMAGILAAKIKQKYGIPYVLAEYGNPFDLEHELFPKWLYEMIGETFNHHDALIVPSSGLADFMTDTFGADTSNAVWVPIAVDDWFFTTELKPPAKKEEGFVFFNIGNFNENKGHEDLIRAFGGAFKDNESVTLRIVGDGPDKEFLEGLSSDLGVWERVVFLGRVSNERLTEELAASDAFVLPSRYETLGTVVAEAMACGKPAIGTTCWGPKAVIQEGLGLIVPSRDPESMGKAMLELYSEIDTYDPQAIRDHCLKHYTEEAVCKSITNVYDSVMT
jgi:glycosyltransferase involved in cell wall biosynthesis